MKLVFAVIRPQALEAVTAALHDIGVAGITLTEVKGHGRQGGHTEVYRGGEYQIDYLPKIELKILSADGDAEKTANTIADAARSGKIGDGKIWIQPVEVAMRIRTGEIGDEAV
jgi:nitrogen regulatory protein P-II 1